MARPGDDRLKAEEPAKLVHAIECLGDLKSIAAVNPLMRLLGYRRSFWWDGTGLVRIKLPTDRYPAGGSLARIGAPALPNVLEAIIAARPGSSENNVLFYIIIKVFRDEQLQGLLLLKKAAIVAETGGGSRRLLLLARRYAEYYQLEGH